MKNVFERCVLLAQAVLSVYLNNRFLSAILAIDGSLLLGAGGWPFIPFILLAHAGKRGYLCFLMFALATPSAPKITFKTHLWNHFMFATHTLIAAYTQLNLLTNPSLERSLVLQPCILVIIDYVMRIAREINPHLDEMDAHAFFMVAFVTTILSLPEKKGKALILFAKHFVTYIAYFTVKVIFFSSEKKK